MPIGYKTQNCKRICNLVIVKRMCAREGNFYEECQQMHVDRIRRITIFAATNVIMMLKPLG